MSAGGDEVQIDLQRIKGRFDPFGSKNRSRERSSSEEDQGESASAAFQAKRDRLVEEVFSEGLTGLGVGRVEKTPHLLRLKRSSSSDDLAFMDLHDTLPLEYMQVDTDLCAQWLIFHRRKAQVEAVQSALQVSKD